MPKETPNFPKKEAYITSKRALFSISKKERNREPKCCKAKHRPRELSLALNFYGI